MCAFPNTIFAVVLCVMNTRIRVGRVVFLFLVTLLSSSLSAQSLPDVSTRSAAGDRGGLRDFLSGTGTTLVALNLARTQENGEEQLERVLDTHTRLERLGVTRTQPILHINVIAGAPRLVHGLIRRGLAGEYRDPVQSEQIIVLFVDDVDEFAREVGVPVTTDPAWLAVRPDGRVVWWERDTGPATADRLRERL